MNIYDLSTQVKHELQKDYFVKSWRVKPGMRVEDKEKQTSQQINTKIFCEKISPD
jgi:hypothetical protein